MKFLFLSSDRQEVIRTVKWLLRSGVRCGVCREGGDSCHGVWVQDEHDFPKALRIRMLHAKPRPLPPWASVLESIAPASERAQRAGGMVFGAERPDPVGPEGASAVVAVKPREASCVGRNSWEAARGKDRVWVISGG